MGDGSQRSERNAPRRSSKQGWKEESAKDAGRGQGHDHLWADGSHHADKIQEDGVSTEESSLAEKQIFAEPDEDNEDAVMCGIPVKSIRESVVSYKRDTKNFFVGDLLGNCSRRARRHDDQWYAWTKDMMESIDRNEEVMAKILLSEGHDRLGSVMQDGCKGWSDTIEDKVRDLLDGLQSIESMIRSRRGMSTIWGRIKYRGVFKNNVRQYLSKAKSGGAKALDLVDYARHKSRRWDEHLEKMRSKEKQEALYDFK